MINFIQQGPELKNTFSTDKVLQLFLEWQFPKDLYQQLQPDLENLGEQSAAQFLQLAQQAEREQPKHIPYTAWGKRVDEIRVSSAWQRLQDIAAEEGLVAIGYERKQSAFSRLYQFAKLYLYHASSAFFTCPLAMADGAARVLEKYGRGEDHRLAFGHLTSREPHKFWTSGQWMTEKTGGSDVSCTSTIAHRVGNHFELKGIKWFSSATTSQMALGLARIEGAAEGSQGLSLFYIPMRDQNGGLNGIIVNRLKDKMGTRALPTAELTLDGCKATLVGEENQGVKAVTVMLNITRLYNSITAVSEIQRGFTLSRDYALKRHAFGSNLASMPLHTQTLADMRVRQATQLCLTLHLAYLLGKEEVGEISAEERRLLRLLTPVIKLSSAKDAVVNASETMEAIGGAGYIEDTGIPVILRNSQVFPIWEGTTNVLSLDVLRALKTPDSFEAYVQTINKRLEQIKTQELKQFIPILCEDLKTLKSFIHHHSVSSKIAKASCRGFAFSLGRVYAASLMLEWADHYLQTTAERLPAQLARRFIQQGLTRDIKIVDESEQVEIQSLVYD
jgi:alkylation response protein AidB-like acyl-CoA dehydrogenase